MSKTLGVMALGDVPRSFLEVAAQGAARVFELQAFIDPPLAEPKYALNPARGQHHAASIIRKLGQSQLHHPRDLILAVGLIDLFEPDGEFVYGDGDVEASAAVIGTARFRTADEERMAKRIAAVAAWAAGLGLGLRDCEDSRCAMSPPRIPEELEKRTGILCQPCTILLSKGGKV